MVAFQAGYSFWDTVATAYLEEPALFTSQQRSLAVVTRGPDSPSRRR
jgi:inosine-uridine nucleoside N-ribohydrolase